MVSEAELALRIGVAVVLGALIGLEREVTGQVAGLRTHITISLGAAVFAIASAYSFTEFVQPTADTNYRVDVTRIASNIVTGVGFLGGGAILKHGASVRGLTTAGSMWVTAAVGLVVGLGGYYVGVLSTAVLLVVLAALRAPRRWLRRIAITQETVIIRLRRGTDTGEIINALYATPDIQVQSLTVKSEGSSDDDDQSGEPYIQVDVKGSNLETRLAPLGRREEVTDIDISD